MWARQRRCRIPRLQRLDVRVALVGEADDLEQLADHPGPSRGRDAVAAPEEVEVLPDPQVVVDAVEVGHVADPTPHLDRVGHDVDAADQRLARGRRQQGGQHLHGGRLAGAVRADQAVDLPGADHQVDAGHRQLVVVALDQAARLDDRRHRAITPVIRAPAKTETWPKSAGIPDPVIRTRMRPASSRARRSASADVESSCAARGRPGRPSQPADDAPDGHPVALRQEGADVLLVEEDGARHRSAAMSVTLLGTRPVASSGRLIAEGDLAVGQRHVARLRLRRLAGGRHHLGCSAARGSGSPCPAPSVGCPESTSTACA